MAKDPQNQNQSAEKQKKPDLPQELLDLYQNGLKALTQPLEERITELELHTEKLESQIQASEGDLKTLKEKILKALSSVSSSGPDTTANAYVYVKESIGSTAGKVWMLRLDTISQVNGGAEQCSIHFATTEGPVEVKMALKENYDEVHRTNWLNLLKQLKVGKLERLPVNNEADYEIEVLVEKGE